MKRIGITALEAVSHVAWVAMYLADQAREQLERSGTVSE